MSLSNHSVSNSPTASILLKAKRFSIFSIFTLTAIIANPLLAKAQIAVDGSTATEVKGNTIAPVDKGTTNGGNLYHSFDKFNVPNSGVIFNTGNSSVDGTKVNNIINRVTGDTPSSILGTIESRSAFPNANLYLLNPNGVVFSPNARLDIGGSFHVTTGTSLGFDQNQKFSVDKNSLSFPSGDPKNIQFAIAQPAAIINQGNLTVDAGKNISVTAGTVINTGNLTAPNGNVNVAAVSGNSQVELRSPDLVLGFAVNKDVIPSNWNGAIATLPKLAESLTGQASQANQVVVKPDGTIALVASPSTSDIAVKDGMNITSGKIDVSSSTGKGGNVGVFGNQVGLVNSFINASGNTGGGTVLIGGDLQGKGILPNALQTYVDSRSQIFANGLLTGDGGKVIVWADRSTQFLGAIAAKGGDVSGDGGFVEVSGKENLDYRGSTNTLAPNGKIGTLLLDPANIFVIATGGNSTLANASVFTNASPINASLAVSLINSALSNVVLQATNDITFEAPINITTSGVGITAQAGNTITVGNQITTNGGNVSLIANDPVFATNNGNISIIGDITTQGGAINVTVNNAGQLSIAFGADLSSNSGNISLQSNGINSRIVNQGNITTGTGAISLDASSTNFAAINLGAVSKIESGSGSININGTSVNADGFLGGSTDVRINSTSGNISINGTSTNGNGISGTDNLAITSSTGDINLTGLSTGGTGGNGVLLQTGNVIQISTTSSNINITGNAVNSSRLGVNIEPLFAGADVVIGSGTGNLTFTSDRSGFPNVTGLGGTGTLSLKAFSPNAALTIGGSNAFLSNSFLTSLANSSGFSNVVIGEVTSNNAITVAQNSSINTSNFAPITIQTARTFNGNGFTIGANSSQFNLTANQGISSLGDITNNNGSITLLANQNITTGNITAAGNAIAITSTSGAIDTSAGSLGSGIATGNGGVIALTALGNITVGDIFSSTSNGNGGNISINSTGTNGVIAVNGVLDSFSTNNGTGGNVLLQSAGNITTNNLIISAASNGNGGNISYISSGGAITANQRVRSASAGTTLANGNGGNILFQAAGNIITSEIISQATGAGSGGNITVISNLGGITTNGNVTSSASNSSSGNGGNVRFLAEGAILVTGNINPSANPSPAAGTEGQISITSNTGSLNLQNLGNSTLVELLAEQNITTRNITTIGTGNISITSNAGAINTSSGTVSNDANGNSGEITFSAFGNISTGRIDSNSDVGKPGSISLTSTNGSILLNGDISTESDLGTITNVGNITLTGNVSLLAPVSLDVEDDGFGANINLANANITGNQQLVLTLGSGTANLGAIGTSAAPLASLIVANPLNIGSIVFNNNIFTVGSLTFDAPVTLANNVAIATSGNTINFNSTINGNRSLSLNAADNSIFFNGLVGNLSPLVNLTLNSTLLSNSGISVRASGDISTNAIGSSLNRSNIDIQTAGTFTPNGNTIESIALNLSANQGITNLGNIITSGGNATITSTTGGISAATSTTINTSSIDSDGGNISITANNGSLSLQNLNSSTTNGDTDSNAGNITLTVAGSNNISVANVIASRNSPSNGNAGNLSFAMGTGNITLTGNNINLSATGGKGGSVTFPNPVILSGPPLINSFSVNTRGTTSSGNVIFNDTLTSPSGYRLSVLTSSGNITFNSTVGLSTAPLAQFLLDSDNTITLANTVFASNITSNQGLTVINGNIVATGTFVPSLISLGNFTLNGDISLVGDEINLTGTGTNTALGNITLKPFTTGQAISIGGTGDTGTGTLDLLATDISKFGAGGSLTIGHESGTGAISFAGATTFNRPTTVRSPLGAGTVSIFNNITATGNLTVQAGSDILVFTTNGNRQINSTSGPLSVILNADRDADNSGRIALAAGTSINSNGGDVVLGGGLNPLTTPAVSTSTTDSGVSINGNINASGGNVTVRGSNTLSSNGVRINGGGQVITNGTGNITIEGTGGSGSSNNQGIAIFGTGSLVQAVNGNIALTGTISGGTINNDGIRITDSAIVRTTGTGNLNLTGTNNATGSGSTGILMAGATLETTGTGNITLTGTSGTGTSNNTGISLGNTTSLLGEINAASGAITLTGNSRGTSNNNLGVFLGGNITVNTNGNNEINVIGTGGNGINNNMGILVSFSSSLLSVRNGNLNLTGTGRGTGTGNDGVFVSSGIVDAIGTGNITLSGVAPTGSFGINLFSADIKPSNTTGELRFTADEMNATGTNSIGSNGNGGLFIEPATVTRNIILGAASNASNSNLEINNSLLSGIQNSFSQVFIGRDDSSGLISLGSDVVFNNPVTLRSPLTTGAINTSGFNFRNITGNVTFLANQNITAGNIIASGNATSLTSTSGAINTSSGTIDTSSDGSGGNISFSSATGSTVGSLNTASKVTGNAGAISFSNGNITFAGSSINVSSNNGNAQNLTFGFPVTLSNSNLTINTGSLSGTNGAVTFSNVVNGSIAGVNNLTINSGSGSIAFNNSVGSSTIPLGAIFVNSTDTTRFNSTVNAASLNTNASGTIALNGNVTTTTSQIYNGAVNFTNALQLTSTNNDITFNSTVNGNQNVTVTSGTGNITFGGAVGSSSNPFGNLVANSTVITRFNSTVDAASLTTSAGGTTELNGNITTSGTQTFNDAVSLTNAVQLNTTNSAIAFGSTVNGTQNLTLNSGTANISFAGAVGNISPLGNIISNTTGVTAFNGAVNATSLTTNTGGNTELNGNVTTSGSQTYNDQVILQNGLQLSTTNSPIAFNNLVNGARNLTVSTGTANITFAGAVGNLQPLLALTTTSTGTITFTNPVIANSITSNSGTTVINGNLTANGANGNGITLRNFSANGDISLIGDELNLLGTGSGTGNLSIAPFTSGQAIAIGGAGETVNTTLDLTASDLTALSGGTFSSLTIGNSLSTSAINLAGNANFAQRTTIQSPVGAGSINSSGFNLTNTGGSITLSANQNVTTGNIAAAGNAISLTSTSGEINTSAGRVSTATNVGNAGSITFQAFGNITTGSGTTPNPAIASFIITGGTGNPSSITFTSTNGAINTSLGDIDAGGGNITFVARNNITTSGVFSRASNGGTISLTSQTGAINTSAGDVTTTTTDGRGTGGNITLTANGSVTTKGVFATGDDGKIVIDSTTGAIDTTSGSSSLASVGTNNSITLTARQNILTRDIFASGQNTSLSITSTAGLINTSLGTLNTSGTTGDAGSISLNAGASSIIGNLNASSTVGNAGAIAFNISGNTTFTGSDINGSSATGSATNINFSSVILNTPSLVINTSGGTNSGSVTFSGNLNGTTANVNNLSINAGAGDINFEQIGNTVPLGFLSISTSGTTSFNTVRAGSIQTLNGGSGGAVKLLGNITTNGNIAFNGAASVASNIVLNSSAGNGPIFFNGAIANDSGTPSNLTLNAGTGNIEINQGVGSSARFGNITVTNAGNVSTGGEPIFARSFTQLAGTGRTSFGGNDNFTGSVTVTTDNVSVDEGATLIASNVGFTALNGFRSNPASRLEVTGTNSEGFFPGSININADSNSDGTGTFLNRGTITDGGLGGNVTVRAAILDITGSSSITAKDIFLSPSTTAPTIAIGSSATGTFRLVDAAIGTLNASNLISIAANNGNVNIGSTQAFDPGTSLEIGTAVSPANTITANTGSTLSVTRNLSATGTTIALGNTTVGGNLALTGNNIVLSDTTANNLTLRLRNQVSQTGTVNVVGQTNLIIDTNPLTNVLLADFANNFGSSITLSFANLSTTSFNNLEFRTVSNGAQFNVAPQQINNLKLILDNGTIALSSIPLTGSLTLSARDVSINGNITATSASLTSLNGGNVTINNNFTTTTGDLAIANSGLLTVNSGVQLDLQGALVQSGTGAAQFGGNIGKSTSVSFAAPIALIGNSIINSSGNVTFASTVNGARSLTVNTGGITLFNRAVGETTPLTDITTDAAGTTQINGNVITSGSQNFNDRVLISSNSFLDSSRGNGNINLGNIANAIAGTPINLNLNAGQGNIVLRQVGTSSDPFGNITISNAGDVSTGSLNTARNLSFTANTIAFGNTTVAGNLAIAPTTKVSQTGPMSVTGTTSFILNQSSPDILLADFSNNSFNGGISFLPNGTSSSLKVGNFELLNTASGAGLNAFPAFATNVKLIFANSTIALPSVSLTGNLDLSAKDISLNGAITALSASLTGENITINNSVTTSSGSLAISNSGTFSLNPNANLDLSGNLLLSGGGTTAIGGNITRSSSIDFVQPVLLRGNSNIVSNGNITFEKSVNGAFALNLDTNGNFVVLSGAIGDTTPLTSFAIAANTTLTSQSSSLPALIGASTAPIQISTTGNILVGLISNPSQNVTLNSSSGSITTSSITTRSTIGNAGNVELTANGNVTTSDIDASSLAAGSNGGSVNVTSRTGQISTGNITTTAQTGGEIFINASTAIDVGFLNSSGSIRAGDVTLDPVGDVVVRAIDASSANQGGNVTLVSTGGNLRITDTLLSSTASSCVGASICTSGGTGGNISLQTGGLNPFLVDDATLNGSKGFLTTGTTTLNLGTSIPVILSSSFIQGGIKITPGGVITSTPTDSTQPFVTPDSSETVSTTPNGDNKSLGNADVFKKEAARYLDQGNLPRAFDSLERSYGSELEAFLGRPLNLPSITIDESQDVLAKVAQQTGDVAALIYPVLLDNRIEIMVVPPKDKGKPFRKFSVVPSQEAVESILTDYRNNIRDVGSNDYLEQSQVLYDLIMRPIDTQLKAMKINTLVFVMDAGLRVVPPAAMHDGKQFVVERYGIASVASMRVTKIEERDRKSTRILAMGLTDAVSGFSALPSVDVEIKTIASNVLEGSSFLNKDFTVSNLQAQRQLGKYNILHLGTHGKFVSDNSGESFIQFWDSRLSLSEIPELRFDKPAIDMLTLSACQTAVGNNLGISGLAVESGAKSVLASLWEVSDAGTAPLMISFYKAFPDAINKAQAMQKAQVSLLSGKVNIQNGQITGILGLPNVQLPAGIGDIDLSHPFYWSSFILVGNWL
jgi:CHAT domain-containing protein